MPTQAAWFSWEARRQPITSRTAHIRFLAGIAVCCRRSLSVEPEVFEARAVIDAVDHVGEAPHLRLPAGRNAAVEDDRPRVVLDQLLLDLPDQPFARARIGLSGLLLD
jgi:hypothetical protein